MKNMNIYVSDSLELYKDTFIGHLENTVAVYLLLHLVQCWYEFDVDESNQAIPVVL